MMIDQCSIIVNTRPTHGTFTSRSTSVCIRCVICETIHLPSLIVMRISLRNKKTFTLHVAVHLYMFCQATTFFH